MQMFIYDPADQLVSITTDFEDAEFAASTGYRYCSRNDWDTKEQAEKVAADATAFSRRLYVVSDRPNVSPRYDVVDAPSLGDRVSYYFNGDTYPDGEIARVSKTLKVMTTTTGNRYYRSTTGGSWTRGSWSLVRGHRTTRNPSF